jgi:hypothetical protein
MASIVFFPPLRWLTGEAVGKSGVAIVPPPVEAAKARDQAAAAVGVSPRYVSDAKRVKAKSPESPK